MPGPPNHTAPLYGMPLFTGNSSGDTCKQNLDDAEKVVTIEAYERVE